jgi:hypothetical protein
MAVRASALLALLMYWAVSIAAADGNVFSVQFFDYASGPLDPAQQELIEALQEKVTVYIYPTTYSQHSVQLLCLNFTVICVGDNPRCTPSAVFEFAGPNSSAEFAAIQSPGPGGFEQLATDISVSAIAIGVSLYGTSVAAAAPAGSGLTTEILIYVVAIPGAVLVLLLTVWLLMRIYIKKHKYDDDDPYGRGIDDTGAGDVCAMGEELLSREHLNQA